MNNLYGLRRPEVRLADGGGNFLTRMFTDKTKVGSTLANRAAQIEAATASPPVRAPIAAPIDPNNPAGIRFADGGYARGLRTGYANGGPAPRAYSQDRQDGGQVMGEGDGTVDTVPAKYAPGEYVLPADTAKAVGYDNLETLRRATHTPVAQQINLRRMTLRDPEKRSEGYSLRAADGGFFPGGTQQRPDDRPKIFTPDVRGLRGDLSQEPVSRVLQGSSPSNEVPGLVGSAGTDRGLRPASGLPRGPFTDLTGGILPGSRAVGRGLAEDLSEARKAPTIDAALGQGVRSLFKAAVATPFAFGEDLLEPATRLLRPITTGAVNAGATALTGDNTPFLADSPPTSLRRATPAPVAAPTFASNTAPNSGPQPDPGPQANVTRVGSSFSGNNVTGNVVYSDGLRSGFGVSSPGSPGDGARVADANLREANALESARKQQEAEGIARQDQQVALGLRQGQQFEDERALRNARIIPRTASGADRAERVAQAAAAEARVVAGRASDTALAQSGLRERGEAQRAANNSAVQLRGQDIQREVAQAPARLAAQNRALSSQLLAQAGGDYEKAARLADLSGLRDAATDFRSARSADIANTGAIAAQGTAANTARAASQKALTDEISGFLPARDGKPDLDTAARYSVALNADVDSKKRQLQADVRAGKNGAAAALADLEKNGAAALGDTFKRNFINGMKAKDLVEQYASGRLNPTGGTGVVSDAPVASLRRTSDGFLGFGGEYEAKDAAGNFAGTLPRRAVESDGSFIGGLRRNDLDNLIIR